MSYYEDMQKSKKKAVKEERQRLLDKYRVQKLVIDDNTVMEFKLDFDGYGDSGQVYPSQSYPDDINQFLSQAVDAYVEFDWYNNDGGGGDITWDLRTDKITINGYYNETVQHNAMDEVEF